MWYAKGQLEAKQAFNLRVQWCKLWIKPTTASTTSCWVNINRKEIQKSHVDTYFSLYYFNT